VCQSHRRADQSRLTVNGTSVASEQDRKTHFEVAGFSSALNLFGSYSPIPLTGSNPDRTCRRVMPLRRRELCSEARTLGHRCAARNGECRPTPSMARPRLVSTQTHRETSTIGRSEPSRPWFTTRGLVDDGEIPGFKSGGDFGLICGEFRDSRYPAPQFPSPLANGTSRLIRPEPPPVASEGRSPPQPGTPAAGMPSGLLSFAKRAPVTFSGQFSRQRWLTD